jgi:hypothetical protein
MKKTMAMIMCAGSVLMFSTSHAQDVPAPSTSASSADAIGRTTFGIRAGVNFANITGRYANDSKMKNDLITGFNVGVNAELPIAPTFFIQPGVLFTTRGAKMEKTSSRTYDEITHLSYVEIPVNFVYKPLLGTGRLIAGFGPYVDFGVGGKIKYEGTGAPGDVDVKFQNEVSSSDNNDFKYYRSFGAGANVLFGYEFANKLSFQLNAQLGLTDINPKYEGVSDTDAKANHTGFGISAGYRF